MKSISIKWKPFFARLEAAIREAGENKATHFRFAESAEGDTLLILGTKEELKASGKSDIYSALPYDPMDPETWGAWWIPGLLEDDEPKALEMWSDEYEAQKKGIPFQKGGFKS